VVIEGSVETNPLKLILSSRFDESQTVLPAKWNCIKEGRSNEQHFNGRPHLWTSEAQSSR
jgi:hypothetical protein